MAGKKYSVLIADDSTSDRFLLKEAIRYYAPLLYVVGEVSDGKQVIEYLSGQGKYTDREAYPSPELLILDVTMPLVTGIEVLEWLKTQRFPLLTVAMMGDSSSGLYRDKALSLGANHFHSKDLDGHELVKTIKRLQAQMENPHGLVLMNTTEIPPLSLDGKSIESHAFPIILVWGDLEVSRFVTLEGARVARANQHYPGKDLRTSRARLCAWDGKSWTQLWG